MVGGNASSVARGHDADSLAAFGTLSGLQRARNTLNPTGLRSPVYRYLDLPASEVEAGRATHSLQLDPRFLDGRGGTSMGVLGVLADAALGNAALTVLPAGSATMTSQLRIDGARPLGPESQRLRCSGTVAGFDGVTVLATGQIQAEDGTVVATALARCFAAPTTAYTPAGVATEPPLDPPPDESRPPVEVALGLRVQHRAGGEATLSFDAPYRLSNIFGMIHGGPLAAVLEYASWCAAGATDGPAAGVTMLDCSVRYLRGVAGDDTPKQLTARTLHRTRRLATVECLLTAADGITLTSAEATYLITPARGR
ncbi:MAG TPA: PaaI family thioesterase [Mycobacteriales bacterium]|nr:PaaI family thioesterase [Mycobacteriales bacterium]